MRSPPDHSAYFPCRRRKIKCITGDDHPRSPCKRCSQHGSPCEFVSVSEEELSTPEPATPDNGAKWLPPLVPESYGRPRKQDANAIPDVPHPKVFDGYTTGESVYSSDTGSPLSFYSQDYPQEQSYASSYAFTDDSFYYGDGSFDVWGNQPQLYSPSANVSFYFPSENVHYGPFPGPANTVYPWTRR
ncbi:hypothetical protein B0H17DRAFT_1326307 [Mycena rosella]|uniref:Zn(2)-C6 fungal-type domain-containing protein n=1 Tax=Mycena rosella TaxID=1033263 RepID=A0AAD7GUJ4_MYCRO|nr:hypothetical protein B0H17DRAFT_1326307 [Mycena rosella]